MIVLNYIMGHTLTLSEDTVAHVLANIKLSAPPASFKPYTSPRLATRQLKFFFALQRSSMLDKLLRWYQQALHTSANKNETWMRSFCVILGFAMLFEEIQWTLQIEADVKTAKVHMAEMEAETEAFNACERIDNRFQLLIGLFQCKYRDRKWNEGDFGLGTPTVDDEKSQAFLHDLRSLVEQNSELWRDFCRMSC